MASTGSFSIQARRSIFRRRTPQVSSSGSDAAVTQRSASHAERAAQVECTVLITGETGTGKEVWARLLQRLGPRREEALYPCQLCGANGRRFAESQLFRPRKRGAFTGASGPSLGVFPGCPGQANRIS